VLLGAMALLGLVGLLHSGLSGILSIRPRGRSLRLPLEARKRAGTPRGTWRVVVRRMIWPAPKGCQTQWDPGSGSPAVARPATTGDRRYHRQPAGRSAAGRRPARIPQGSMRESPCDAVRAGAILSGPSAPETFAGVLLAASDVAVGSESSGPPDGRRTTLRDPGTSISARVEPYPVAP
jgi:hypothetical protein